MSNQEIYIDKIMGALKEVFDNKDSEHFIDVEVIDKTGDGNDLMYALGCAVPAQIYSNLTKKPVDALQFNHIANILCFQNLRLIAYTQQKQSNEVKPDKK